MSEADETSVTQSISPVETFATSHTTRLRLTRLEVAFGDKLGAALKACDKEGFSRAKFFDMLCMQWFGPIDPNRAPRSDRGSWHRLPERVWSLHCGHCGAVFDASRWDARFCRNACRQAAYRERIAGAPR
jgi:hypothetical protein